MEGHTMVHRRTRGVALEVAAGLERKHQALRSFVPSALVDFVLESKHFKNATKTNDKVVTNLVPL